MSYVEEVEQSLKQSRERVELLKSLERLKANPDFQRVVLKGYLTEEPVRLVHLKAEKAMQTPERQQSILQQIDAIGMLNNYFNVIHHLAMQATKEIEDHQEALANEAVAEEELV